MIVINEQIAWVDGVIFDEHEQRIAGFIRFNFVHSFTCQ